LPTGRSLTQLGTGLFIASGKALNTGGPASLVISFSLIGIMLYCTIQALGEMAVVFPVAGSFSAYSTRFLDPSWGFAMGWVRGHLPFFVKAPC
jgi:amino acid transporter